MSEPDFLLCDICGERVPKEMRLFAQIDSTFNGNEYDADGRYVDLCHAHMHQYLSSKLKPNGTPDFDAGKDLVKFIKYCRK